MKWVMFMERLQIQYFMTVARYESISRAAQEFMVPPSSVSVAIKKLETELGVALFERSANRLTLGAAGKILRDALEKVNGIMADVQVRIQNLSETVSGEIRLLILSNRARVTRCISAFQERYPNTAFNIRHDGKLDYKGYDIILTDRHIETEGYERHLFCREELMLAVSKRHPLAGKDSVALSDLGEEKFICMTKESSLGECTRAAFQKAGITPDIAIECDDPQYVLSYLKLGLGICFFPSKSWENKKDEHIHLLTCEEGLQRTSYLYVRKNATRAVSLFAEKFLNDK